MKISTFPNFIVISLFWITSTALDSWRTGTGGGVERKNKQFSIGKKIVLDLSIKISTFPIFVIILLISSAALVSES